MPFNYEAAKYKVSKILADLDISQFDSNYSSLFDEGIAMRNHGLTWARIEKALAEKAVL